MCDISYIQGLVKRIYGKQVEPDQIVPMQVSRAYTDGLPPRPFVTAYPDTEKRPDVVYYGVVRCIPHTGQVPDPQVPVAKLFGEDNGSATNRALDLGDVYSDVPETGFRGEYGPMLFEAVVIDALMAYQASFVFVGYEIRTTT